MKNNYLTGFLGFGPNADFYIHKLSQICQYIQYKQTYSSYETYIYVRKQWIIELQLLHAFLDREWDPKTWKQNNLL
jgi:hypothetical protein